MYKILGLLIFSLSLNAFELRSWNLDGISNENINNKNIDFIKIQTNGIYDVMCLQGIKDKGVIEKIVNNKSVFYSQNTNNQEYLGWITKSLFKEVEIIDYEDKENIYQIKPSMLILKDVNIGIINFNSILTETSPIEEKKKEINEINLVFSYFQKHSKLDYNRIFMCGSFNLTYGRLRSYLGDFFTIANKEGTTISDKYGYTNNDFDHFISIRNDKGSPDYDYINSYGVDYKRLKEEVSSHIPIKINF